MLEFLATAFWIGGIQPAYRHDRRNFPQRWRINSIIHAAAWPIELGWVMADRYCKDILK